MRARVTQQQLHTDVHPAFRGALGEQKRANIERQSLAKRGNEDLQALQQPPLGHENGYRCVLCVCMYMCCVCVCACACALCVYVLHVGMCLYVVCACVCV